MTVMVELSPAHTAQGAPAPAAPTVDPDALVVIDSVEDYTADTQPGCNDDNPYR